MNNKNWLFWLFLALATPGLLSACAAAPLSPSTGSPEPTNTPAVLVPTPTAPAPPASPTPEMTSEIPPQFLTVQAEIARTYGYTVQEVALVSYEAVDWPDSCLGIHQEGMACLDVITPGYKVIFSSPQGEIEAHTNTDGSVYRIAADQSGIDGLALLINACPGPIRLETPCPELPYQGIIVVLDASGAAIAEVQTTADGRFRLDLPPGSYTLTGPPGIPRPALAPQEVAVQAGEYTQVELRLDSGMR